MDATLGAHDGDLIERHAGRPLDASRDDVLRDSALSLLAELGYDRLTMDAIAQRAGAGKATIYRRWSCKADLVVDALACQKVRHPVPNTGTLRGDLDALTDRATDDEPQMDAQVMIGLVSALPHDEELRVAFQGRLVDQHVEVLRTIFSRAAERGEIDEPVDLDLIVSIFPAMVLHRLLVHGEAPEPAFIRKVIDDIILPVVLGSSSATRRTPSPPQQF